MRRERRNVAIGNGWLVRGLGGYWIPGAVSGVGANGVVLSPTPDPDPNSQHPANTRTRRPFQTATLRRLKALS